MAGTPKTIVDELPELYHELERLHLVPIERGGERRVIAFMNPGLGGKWVAANTLWAGRNGASASAFARRHSLYHSGRGGLYHRRGRSMLHGPWRPGSHAALDLA